MEAIPIPSGPEVTHAHRVSERRFCHSDPVDAYYLARRRAAEGRARLRRLTQRKLVAIVAPSGTVGGDAILLGQASRLAW